MSPSSRDRINPLSSHPYPFNAFVSSFFFWQQLLLLFLPLLLAQALLVAFHSGPHVGPVAGLGVVRVPRRDGAKGHDTDHGFGRPSPGPKGRCRSGGWRAGGFWAAAAVRHCFLCCLIVMLGKNGCVSFLGFRATVSPFGRQRKMKKVADGKERWLCWSDNIGWGGER